MEQEEISLDRGMSHLDRVALRIVSAILIAGILWQGSVSLDVKTRVEVIDAQMKSIHESLNKDKQHILYRLNQLEKRIYDLEHK